MIAVPLLAGAVAVLWWVRIARESGGFGLAAWAVAVTAGLWLCAAGDGSLRGLRLPLLWAPAEGALLVLLVVAAAALRLYRLADLPPMIHGDSAECGLRGLEILSGSVADVLDFSDWYWTPYVSFLPYAASFSSFGVSLVALRLPSAIAGTLALIPLYFLARHWFGVRVGLMTAALYATLHPAVHFSRIGLWNIQVLLLSVTAFALVAAAFARGSALLAGLAGLAAGLGLYGYTAGRIIFLTIVAVVSIDFLSDRAGRHGIARFGVAFVSVFAIAVLPLLINYVREPSVFSQDRTYSVSLFAEENRYHVESTLGRHTPSGILTEQTRRTLAGFYGLGDQSTQYGSDQPILSRVGALLLALGLLLMTIRPSHPRHRFVLAWFWLNVVLGSVLILDPPSYTRLIVLFPAVCVIMAAGADGVLRQMERRAGLPKTWCVALGLLVIAHEAWFSVAGYGAFVRRMRSEPREWDVVRAFERSGTGVDYYLFTGPFMFADAPFFQLFFGRERAISGLTESDLPTRLSGDTVFVLMPEYRRVGLAIERRYPGVERDVVDSGGRPQVFVYRCTGGNGCRGSAE